jgi:hypothetical protein
MQPATSEWWHLDVCEIEDNALTETWGCRKGNCAVLYEFVFLKRNA